MVSAVFITLTPSLLLKLELRELEASKPQQSSVSTHFHAVITGMLRDHAQLVTLYWHANAHPY